MIRLIRFLLLLIVIIPLSLFLSYVGYITRYTRINNSFYQASLKEWAKVILWGLWVKVESEGVKNLESKEPQLLLCNHSSNLDPIVLWCIKPKMINLCFAAKVALFELPILGRLLRWNKSVMIDRLAPKESLKKLYSSFEASDFTRSMVIFPEGTRNLGQGVLPFKRGPFLLAKKYNLRIVPISLTGTGEALPKGKFLSKPKSTVRVSCMEPIESNTVANMSIDELMAHVHKECSNT